MNTRLILIPLLLIFLFGCERQVSLEPYTETKVEWQGATAEEIMNAVDSMDPGPQLAVIDDGGAILYHRGSVAETRSKLDTSAERLPAALMVSTPVAKEGRLPEAPGQKARVQVRWEVDSARAAAHGIRMTEIASRLRGIEFEQDAATAAQAVHGKTIQSPSGAEVPLESLVHAYAITVNRPIILNK